VTGVRDNGQRSGAGRRDGVALDLAVLAALVLFAVLAVLLHNSVAGLGDMATGIRETGTSIQASGRSTAGEIRTSVGQTADAIGGVPLVGGEASQAMRRTAQRSAAAIERETRIDGARLMEAGAQGERDARRTAVLLGWLAFLIPAVLIALLWVPRRLPAWRAAQRRARTRRGRDVRLSHD
jgi:hypothetical protein